jgi:hypothetical protein
MIREPLSDNAIDREIEAVVQEQPSAGFTARVRQRVAAAPGRAPWGAWAPAAAAIVALGLGAAAALDRWPVAPPRPPAVEAVDVALPTPAMDASPRLVLVDPARLPAPSPDTPAAREPEAVSASARVTTPDARLDVVLSAAETATLRRLLGIAVGSRVVPWIPDPLAAPVPAVTPLEEVSVARLEIARVTVEPVVIAALEY